MDNRIPVRRGSREIIFAVSVDASNTADRSIFDWLAAGRSLSRPYRVTPAMVVLVSLVPLYIFIPELLAPRIWHAPELPVDRAIPLLPTWALVYGALYSFLILLPVFVVREQEHVRRTVWAYLLIWLTAYVFFALYPTAAPRPAKVAGEGFAMWGLSVLYGSDPPYNCFPSLHVAHSFVSALAAGRVHRGLGGFAVLCAAFVSISTLFTKQHYVLDVVAGLILALIAYTLFLRRYPRDRVPALDRAAAPALALCIVGLVSAGIFAYWLAYTWNGEVQFEFGP